MIPKETKYKIGEAECESENYFVQADTLINKLMVNELRDVIADYFRLRDVTPDLLGKFWQRTSDACPLECTQAEDQELDFKSYVINEVL